MGCSEALLLCPKEAGSCDAQFVCCAVPGSMGERVVKANSATDMAPSFARVIGKIDSSGKRKLLAALKVVLLNPTFHHEHHDQSGFARISSLETQWGVSNLGRCFVLYSGFP